MKIIKFMYNNFFDDAATVITSSGVDTEFPLTNLQHPWWTKANHTLGHDDQWWKWDIGAVNGAFGIDAIAMRWNNFYTDANSVVSLFAHDTDLGDDPAVWLAHGDALKVPLTYGVDYNSKMLAYYWDIAQVYRWWLLSVDDPNNALGYLYLGRPFGGQYFSPTVNFENAYSIKYVDPSRKRYSYGGQLSVTKLKTFRGMKYMWGEGNPLSAADMIIFRSIFEDYLGQSTPYFLCRDSDDKLNTTDYVENINDWEMPNIQFDQFYGLTIEVKESQ